jgi:hypothetical protein
MRGDRYWMWMGGRLLVGVAIVGWAASYLMPGSGEKEFQKTLDAMKQLHSFRIAVSSDFGTAQNQILWEIDCTHNIMHRQIHQVNSGANPPTESNLDEMHVAGLEYFRQGDGSWSPGRPESRSTAKLVCANLAQGTQTDPFPEFATMIKRGVLQEGDKKTVNGVRCREWLITMKGGMRGLEHDTVCLGLDDHLPYDLKTEWANTHTSYSDYNTPIQFDLPQAAVQATSATN